MLTEQLFDFLAASPSCYHAVQALSDRLTQEGYTQLHEADAWTLTAGGKYFVTRNGSSLLAFRVPAGAPAGFLMAAAHTDSPTFKIKHNPEKKAGPYVQLSTEKYGGMLMGTWFDRPLSVAGRVVTAKDGKLETKLVDVNRDLLVIPSVAIHMNRAANDGFKLMANVDTLPLYGMQESSNSFRSVVAEAAGVKEDEVLKHKMHSEHYHLPKETAELIKKTKAEGGRVIAVGTTSCRTLESVGTFFEDMDEHEGYTDIFIYPGYKFKVIDGLITNFHLPESTLIMLVSAFMGYDNTMNAYKTAVKDKYRFFSFGDAMLIL